jgi:hypothetical protein
MYYPDTDAYVRIGLVHDDMSLQGLLDVELRGFVRADQGSHVAQISRTTIVGERGKGPSCHCAFGLLLPAPNPCVAHSGVRDRARLPSAD